MLIKVALRSLLNRHITVALTVLSIAVSVFVLLGVEHVRQEARDSFARTVSGTDLIVGARTSPLNLLLYSVFRVGNATNNISWQSYQQVASNPKVAWAIPISLGDSHRGYRVMGTSQAYFEHYRYGEQRPLSFRQGKPFQQVYDVVLGSEVASQLGYRLADKLVLAHGISEASFNKHEDKPFKIVGILKPTGTPVDQALYVSLAGIEAIHVDWQQGVKLPGLSITAEEALQRDLTPKSITAFMLGLNSKMATFQLQRQINNYRAEPLLAILPGVALAELWQMMGNMERLLLFISVLVLTASLLGMCTMLLASMRERLRELAILRAIGASPWFIFFLIELEALLITLLGIAVAVFSLVVGISSSQGWLAEKYGIFLSAEIWRFDVFVLLFTIVIGAFVIALIPAIGAYRSSLNAGLTNRT